MDTVVKLLIAMGVISLIYPPFLGFVLGVAGFVILSWIFLFILNSLG